MNEKRQYKPITTKYLPGFKGVVLTTMAGYTF